MWELDCNEGRVPKNWWFQTGAGEDLRVPLTARSSNQSILKEINPEIGWKDWCWCLKLQYFGHLMEELTQWKRPWCWKRLKTGGEEDNRGCDGWAASPTRWKWVWVSSRSWWWTGSLGVLQSVGSQRVQQDWATELKLTVHMGMAG